MAAVFSSKNAHRSSVWLVSHHQPPGAAAYNREGDMGQQGGFARVRGGGRFGFSLRSSRTIAYTIPDDSARPFSIENNTKYSRGFRPCDWPRDLRGFVRHYGSGSAWFPSYRKRVQFRLLRRAGGSRSVIGARPPRPLGGHRVGCRLFTPGFSSHLRIWLRMVGRVHLDFSGQEGPTALRAAPPREIAERIRKDQRP